jgi:hypothetical protein
VSVRFFGAAAGRFVSLSYLFRDAPMGIGIVAGPDHVYVAVNDAYRSIIGGREVVGVSVADAFSDAPPDRFIALLDEVRACGTARFEPDYEARWDRRPRCEPARTRVPQAAEDEDLGSTSRPRSARSGGPPLYHPL